MPRHITKTSFEKGHVPWNTGNHVIKTCLICKKQFKVPFCRENTAKYCSKSCAHIGLQKPEQRKRIKEMRQKGCTLSEISSVIGLAPGSISHYTNKLKLRWGTGSSPATISKQVKQKFGTKCMICGFDRVTEAAHRVPAKDGGSMELENFYVLCPNHHSLYDRNLLTEEEEKFLLSAVSNLN